MDILFCLLMLTTGTITLLSEIINIFLNKHKLYMIGNLLITLTTLSTILFGIIIKNVTGGIIVSILFIILILAARFITKKIRLFLEKHNLINRLDSNKNIDTNLTSTKNSNNEKLSYSLKNPLVKIKIDSIEKVDNIKNDCQYIRPVVHKLRKKLFDYIVLDIETTGLSKEKDGITQVSAIKFKNDKEVDRLDQLLDPQKEIPENVQYLTHITNKMVKDKPTFNEFNAQISKFIGQIPIIGHNIKFDINFLIQNKINLKDIYYEDTLLLSRNKLPDLKNHKLTTLKEHFGIDNISHNALNDCETTAIVYQHLRDNNLEKNVVNSQPIQLHEFDGLRFCITGQFMEMTRDEIKKLINIHGGKVTGSVSGLTDYLIKGKQISNNLTDGIHSSSELKAMELSKNGGKIKIIDLNDLHKMIENN